MRTVILILALMTAMATGATAATNNIPEDAVVVTTTNALFIWTDDNITSYPTFITHWKCPEHGIQWSALSIDDEPYCVECVYGQLIKLLKLKPMKEAK